MGPLTSLPLIGVPHTYEQTHFLPWHLKDPGVFWQYSLFPHGGQSPSFTIHSLRSTHPLSSVLFHPSTQSSHPAAPAPQQLVLHILEHSVI